jgi:hypothetical protein
MLLYTFLPASLFLGKCSLMLIPLFAAGVNDAGNNFAAGVNDTGEQP